MKEKRGRKKERKIEGEREREREREREAFQQKNICKARKIQKTNNNILLHSHPQLFFIAISKKK